MAESSHASVFKVRDENLAVLGFANYEDYLQSDLWAWIRERLGKDSKDECECCKTTTGLSWHHRDYQIPVLAGNFSNANKRIVRVCSECHFAIHSDGTQWFSLDVAEMRFQELAGRRYMVGREAFSRSNLTTSGDSESFSDWASYAPAEV